MRKQRYILVAAVLLFALTACFQDLGQNPPFDFPEEPPKPPISEDGQIFYMSFDTDFKDAISGKTATAVGSPTISEGKIEKAYAGAQNSYLTFKISDIAAQFGSDLTVGFWYKVNAVPDRAGLLVISPITDGANANAQNNRSSGFRIFRENAGGKQRIKANVGNGTADGWLDGVEKADIDPVIGGWKYITLTLSKGKAVLYINAEEVATNNVSQISWNGCDIVSIGSGAPRFTEWGHLSDNSLIDDLRIYNRVLTVAEIKNIVLHDTE